MNITPTATTDLAKKLESIGFGPARSRTFVSKAPEEVANILLFAEVCRAKGFTFRVTQARGRNSYFTRLRINLSSSDNSIALREDCEVGSLGLTWNQVYAIEEAIQTVGNASGVMKDNVLQTEAA